MSLPVPEPDARTRFLIPRPGPDAAGLLTAALRRAGSAPPTTLRWVRLARKPPPGHLGDLPEGGVLVADARSSPTADALPGPALTAALSGLTGGFVLSHPLGPAVALAGCEAGYAGHLLPTETRVGAGTDAAQVASELLDRIAGRSLGVINLHGVTEEGEVAVPARGTASGEDRSSIRVDGQGRLLMAVATADAGEVRRVMSARRPDVRGEWRLLRGLTPEAEIPFTMLRAQGRDDVLPDSVLQDLSSGIGMYAAALDVPGAPEAYGTDASRPTAAARWVQAGPDGLIDSGPADSLSAVVGVLAGFAAVLGTYPATLAWPSSQPGERLDESG